MSEIIRQRSATLQNFVGGLNNYWDQSSIQDNELASLINFEVTTNGALTSRPPIWYEQDLLDAIVQTPAESEPMDIVGVYVEAAGARSLVVVTDDKTWLYNVETRAWTQIATFRASDMTQYQNKVVLSSTTAGAGGYWEAGTFTNTDTMPALGGIELFQNRFFGFGIQGTSTANTVYWSDITTAGVEGESNSIWNWQDAQGFFYVEIGAGDGQWITALAQGYNDIVVFRNRSTYRFSYGELPEEGNMQVMQQDIGAETARCVVKFENAHFVLSGKNLYKYQNWLYYPLNAERVNFEKTTDFTPRFEHSVSVVGRRCIVWHGGKVYAYNLDTSTWSEWSSQTRVGYFVTVPRQSEDDKEDLFYGISGDADVISDVATDYALLRTRDRVVVPGAGGTANEEEMICSLQTKIYDFATPVEWKRLYFWSADLATARTVRAVAVPVAITAEPIAVNWDELSQDGVYDNGFYNFDELSKEDEFDEIFSTWDRPKTPGTIESVIDDFPVGTLTRLVTKLDQSLRFRRIYFELYLTNNGTVSTAPVQVFSLTPMVGVKSKVAKGAN
jgi:hypothetical protein